MSEITRGAIGMPFEMAMESELSRRQFHSIALALLAERDQLKAQTERLDNALSITDAAAQKWLEERTAQQSALAEAWELFDSILNDPRLVVAMPSALLVGVKNFLSSHPAPAAMSAGEQL